MLDEDEQEALNEEDLELYQRWEKKKKKKSGAGMSQVNSLGGWLTGNGC